MKKVLSLVLVICMAFSLVTIASAATYPKYQDYSDASSITEKEAVDTLTAIGVLNGISGAFKPSDIVTREQAAKIICYLLMGSKAADKLTTTTTSFTDVAVSRWSAPMIQFCVVKGIINGFGDGTFRPEESVSAVQFAKMLLTAIGYGKLGEYTGSNWTINTIVDAQNLGILDTGLDYNAGATREQVARYAFNAYTNEDCYTVVLSTDRQSYVPSVSPVEATLAVQQDVYRSDRFTENASTSGATYKLTNVNGVECYRWEKETSTGIDTLTGNWWPVTTEKVLATVMVGDSLADLSDPTSSKYKAKADSPVTYYYNGELQTDAGDISDTIDKVDVCGVIVSLVDTDNDSKYDKVLVVEKRLTKLSAAPTTNAAGMVSVPGICSSQEAKNVKGYDGLVKGDYVLWYLDDMGVYNIQKATVLKGQMTSGNGVFAMFAGGFHWVSGLVSTGNYGSYSEFIGDPDTYFGVDATAILDDGGSIIAIFTDDAEVTKTYGLVLDYNHNGSLSNSANVRLLKEDGSKGIYSIAKDAKGDVDNQGFVRGDIVSYKFNASGEVTLTAPTTLTGDVGPTDYEGGDNQIPVTDGVNDSVYYISSTTKVFYFDNDAAYNATTNPGSVTSGFDDTLSENAGVEVTYVFARNSSTVLAAIVIDDARQVTVASKYAFTVFGGLGGTSRVVDGATVYDYTVYVNGVSTTLTSTSSAMFAGFHTDGGQVFEYTLGAKGYVIDTDDTVTRAVNAGGDIDYVDSNGKYFTYNNGVDTILTDENTNYWEINNRDIPGSISEGEIAESVAGAITYTFVAADLDSDGVADNVYYLYTLS